MKLNWQRSVLLGLDGVTLFVSAVLAFYIRFEGSIPGTYFSPYLRVFPVIAVAHLLSYIYFGLYRRIWSLATSRDLLSIAYAATVGGAFSGWLVFYAFPIRGFPRSVILLSWILNIAGLTTVRLGLRMGADRIVRSAKGSRPTLIVGAGPFGRELLRELRRQPDLKLTPVGFIDESPKKEGLLLGGLPVLGGKTVLPEVIRAHGIRDVIVANPGAPKDLLRELVEICQRHGARVKTISGLYRELAGQLSIDHLRDIRLEDLLGRDPIKVDLQELSRSVKGRRVLITGAGGSIGAELTRQVASLQPSLLVLVGHGENSIFEISTELQLSFPDVPRETVIADVRDRAKIFRIFEKHRPDIVYHAAAHKHVPLMESDPDEAVKTNIFGTLNVGEAAIHAGTSTFVLISTDKAVNPVNVMGATKRVAELIVKDLNSREVTRFVAVRFGNVLGSRGSVIPLFQRQISRGGPITITHPEMARYFMTCTEAVQLVIQAGTLGKGGELFVLDMGDPIKIVDLAENLIRLSGLVPGEDIRIEFTGPRPGERLFEEVLTSEEGTLATRHDRIFVTPNGDVLDSRVLRQHLDQLEKCLQDGGDSAAIKRVLSSLVPTLGTQHKFPAFEEVASAKEETQSATRRADQVFG